MSTIEHSWMKHSQGRAEAPPPCGSADPNSIDLMDVLSGRADPSTIAPDFSYDPTTNTLTYHEAVVEEHHRVKTKSFLGRVAARALLSTASRR
jgi:hypothetical protein